MTTAEMIWRVTMITGGVLAIVGWIKTLREMFEFDRLLGSLAFVVPVVATIYAGCNREDLNDAFWLQIAGIGILMAGASVGFLLGL